MTMNPAGIDALELMVESNIFWFIMFLIALGAFIGILYAIYEIRKYSKVGEVKKNDIG